MNNTITLTKLKMIYLCAYVGVPMLWFVAYIGVWGSAGAISFHSLFIGVFIFFVEAPVHELIHYYCFILFNGAGKENVTLHFNIKNLTAYVICEVATTSRRYKISAVMPFIILGALPSVCGLIFRIPSIGIAGVLAVVSCTGDLILFSLLTRVSNATLVSRYVSREEGRITRVGFVSHS